MRKNSSKSGYLLLDKPAGLTSFEALGAVKRKLATTKVGHTGTLDSFASGLLVVLVGRMTKFASIIEGQQKSYQAVAQIGIETDTLDPSGVLVKELPPVPLCNFEKALPNFLGTIEQLPPLYSALKIAGKRSSDWVRSGKEVSLKKRTIHIDSLVIDDFDPLSNLLTFSLSCSKGTYVRSLIRDWALASGSCGSLVQLTRKSVGNFFLKEAIPPNLFEADHHFYNELDLLDKIGGVEMMDISLNPYLLKKIRYGQKIYSIDLQPIEKDGLIALMQENSLLALLEKKEGEVVYRFNGGL